MALNPDNTNKKIHVFLIPYLSRGHLIPMTDFAKLLAAAHANVEPTMVVTPGNVAVINMSLGQSTRFNHVQILTYPFPSDGPKTSVETIGVGSSVESSLINEKCGLVRPALEELLHKYKPDAVVADSLFSWVPSVAADLEIPCLFFFPSGVFPLVVYRRVNEMQPNMGADDHITVSGLPGPKILMPVSELPNYVQEQEEASAQILDSMFGSQPGISGIVFNTFRAFERDYCKEYERAQTKKAYFVGPVSFSDGSNTEGVVRRGGEGDTTCLRWLDGKEDQSVVFVSFGSMCYFKYEQLRELANGLEGSGKDFLWVVRGDNVEEWMPEGWEERVAERGFMVKGWAPQVAILAHPAIRAFMTHCGWNSTLEGISAGVPMLTWPFAAEEFITERLLVEVIGCAARVWDGGKRSTREAENELVPRSAIARAISKFMEPRGEYLKMRSKAQYYGGLALAAMEEGGSSWSDIKLLANNLFQKCGQSDAD